VSLGFGKTPLVLRHHAELVVGVIVNHCRSWIVWVA
jgi:hypothetical protein